MIEECPRFPAAWMGEGKTPGDRPPGRGKKKRP